MNKLQQYLNQKWPISDDMSETDRRTMQMFRDVFECGVSFTLRHVIDIVPNAHFDNYLKLSNELTTTPHA
jgi:hypothetical protein